MASLDNCKILRYFVIYIGDQENGSDIFNCGLKAWVDNFIGRCGRMYTEFFFSAHRCLLAIFFNQTNR